MDAIRGQGERDGRPDDQTECAVNEALFREVNEHQLSLGDELPDGRLDVVCECGSIDCEERVELSPDEYETVRRFPTRFIVKRGHELADDRVVEQTSSFVVIEKFGEAGIAALRTDPRRRTSASRPLARDRQEHGHAVA